LTKALFAFISITLAENQATPNSPLSDKTYQKQNEHGKKVALRIEVANQIRSQQG
jgi:hypothetical protein